MKECSQGFPTGTSTALERFRIINFVAFLMETTGACLQKAFKQASERTWPKEGGKAFAVRTIEDWWYQYAGKGFDSLVPRARKDRGLCRVLSEEDRLFLKVVSEDHPEYTARQIYRTFVEQRVTERVAGYEAVLRYLNATTKRPRSEVEYDDDIPMASSPKQPRSRAEELLTLGKALPNADAKSLKRLTVGLNRFRILNYVSFLRETGRFTLAEAIKRAVKRHHADEGIGTCSFRTVEDWWYNSRTEGFSALIPKRRSDSGFRCISKQDGDFLLSVLTANPEFTIKQIHGELTHGSTNSLSYSMVCRFLKAKGYTRSVRKKIKVPRMAQIEQAETAWILDLIQGSTPLSQLVSELKDRLPKVDIEFLYEVVVTGALRWRNRAVAILAVHHGIHKSHITRLLRTSVNYVDCVLKKYREVGAKGMTQWVRHAPRKYTREEYTKAVFSILHAPPSDYGINRTTWKMKDIRRIMAEKGLPICLTDISRIIKDGGYSVRKAKRVLTSNDPDYRSKLQRLTAILSNLKQDEKFFSVDEFGPFAVKMRGGRSLTTKGELKTVPQWQKSKGSLILTAALELSENQVTHFYSKKKNTDEMIKLLDVLLLKYPNESKIYFSWDAASWHASKKLYARVEQINDPAYRIGRSIPLVELVPLPSSAQFLNVIESVFSGMAKAILHNSNYESVPVAMAAIDRHFAERNDHYRQYPKRAGRKIWGKERVQPEFAEANNCKDPRYSNAR